MYKVGAYVKLAKLWERSRDEAIEYHNRYYHEKYAGNENFSLSYVYVEITGNKNIAKRPQMLRLLKACKAHEIDVIATQTKAYLAASSEEFFFLLLYLFTLPNRVDIVTEDLDYNINTIQNDDHQREELLRMAKKYAEAMKPNYEEWLTKVEQAMEKLN